MRRIVEKLYLSPANRLGPGQVADCLHALDQVSHDLVIGRDRLAAPFIVKLAAIVVRWIMRGTDVQATVAFQETNRERQLRGGQEGTLSSERINGRMPLAA